MNEKIHILRQAVKVITQALTDSNVKVTQEGVQAYVEHDPRTKKPVRVNLPFLPDNASDELIEAVQGFLDHEVAHVLFTDFKVPMPSNVQVKNLQNMIEDARVEKAMAKKYRGSGTNLENTGNFYIDQILEPQLAECKTDEEKVGSLTVPLIRALSGQEQYQHYLKDKMDIIGDIYEKLEPLAPELEALSSTKDAAKMASKIYKILNEEPPEGTDDDENADDEGSMPNSESSDGEDGEGKDESESGGGTGVVGGEEDEEDGEGAGEEDAEKSDGKGGKSGKSEAGEGDEEGTASPKDTEWKKGDDKDSERTNGPTGAILDSLKDELNGYSESVSTKIAHQSADAIKHAEYRVFSNEGDKVEKLDVPERNYSDSMFARLEDKTREMVGPMQKDLERAIQARSKSVWESGLRRGRLNSSSLARLASTGDDRCFRQRQDSTTKDVAVSLVVDASGSMSGSKIHTAAAAAYAMSNVLDRLKIAHEVICFTTHTPSKLYHDRRAKINEAEKKYKVEYSRTECLYMPIIKGFEERINTETKKRFGWLPNSGMLANNVDGECVEIAYRRLMQRKEKGKIMMVLSDGCPCAAGDYRALDKHLKDVVKGIEATPTKIIGIGIESDAVEHYYSKSVVIRNVNELPSLVISRLKSMLLG